MHSMSRVRSRSMAALGAGFFVLFATNDVLARPARCFTTDDGAYPCDFQATERDGSFAISAPGKPRYMLNMDEPGYAYGFVAIGGRNVSLPGRYRALGGPQGCWINDETKTRICAE